MKTERPATFPYDMGATLPKVQRYTDARFRRVARRFRVDLADAVELVAFLHFVPPNHAKWIFNWGPVTTGKAKMLSEHPGIQELAKPLIEANYHALNVDVGLAVFEAMREGGWKPSSGSPQIIKDTFAELRANGVRGVDLARVYGVKPKTISAWYTKSASKAAARARHLQARSAAALVL